MRWKFRRRSRGCWRRASIGCRPITSKPCSAHRSLAGFFKGACSPIYIRKERTIGSRPRLGNCNDGSSFSHASSKRPKPPDWRKGNTFSNTRSRMMSLTTRCFSPGARNCINSWRKRSKRCFPAGSMNFPRHLVFITSELRRSSGQYFIWAGRPNERKQPLPMRKRSLSTNLRSGKSRALAMGNFVKADCG